MQIVTNLTELPGCCGLCRRTKATEYLDTGIEMNRGRLYLCKEEFTPKQWETLKFRLDLERQYVVESENDQANREYTEKHGLLSISDRIGYACPQCTGKVFATQQALNGHISAHKRQGEWEGEYDA